MAAPSGQRDRSKWRAAYPADTITMTPCAVSGSKHKVGVDYGIYPANILWREARRLYGAVGGFLELNWAGVVRCVRFVVTCRNLS